MNANLVWLGFLPLIVFLLLDTFAGNRRALIGAFIVGSVEAIFSVVKTGGLDYLSLFSFFIMAGFIGLSLRKKDDYYFKIHGPIINILSAIFMLGAWYFFHKALLLDMVIKYIGLDQFLTMDPKMDRETVTEMFRVLSYQLPGWLIFHALITIHAAANWSKWAWASVWVPGFIFTMTLAWAFAQATVLQAVK
jgi:intracellular septation protein A